MQYCFNWADIFCSLWDQCSSGDLVFVPFLQRPLHQKAIFAQTIPFDKSSHMSVLGMTTFCAKIYSQTDKLGEQKNISIGLSGKGLLQSPGSKSSYSAMISS